MLTLFENFTQSIQKPPQTQKIQHPLVFKASRDGRSHIIVGTEHDCLLEAFSEECHDIFSECKVLLTETMAKLSREQLGDDFILTSGTNALIQKLNKNPQVKIWFFSFMESILFKLGVDVPLEHLSPFAIMAIFDLKKRHGIDDTLIELFKSQQKIILQLTATEEMVALWHSNSKTYYSEDAFVFFSAKAIGKHFKTEGKLSEYAQTTLEDYMQKEVEALLYEAPAPGDVDYVLEKNRAWAKLLIQLHQQGTDKILLPCGCNHTWGILNYLADDGFEIQRFIPGKGFINDELFNIKKRIQFNC